MGIVTFSPARRRAVAQAVRSLYCQTSRVHPDINCEDVATVIMYIGERPMTVVAEMSYASKTEIE